MVTLRPEQTLVSYQARLITVDGQASGSGLIDAGTSHPLYGQLSGFTPPPLVWATRDINAGFGPRPVYLHPEGQPISFTSHRFTADWSALVMHLINFRVRGVLQDGSVAPPAANPGAHWWDVTGVVREAPEQEWGQGTENTVQVTINGNSFICHSGAGATHGLEADLDAMVWKSNGVDIMAAYRTALGI